MNTTMKDSGIQWVGEIPINWRVYPAGRLFFEIKEKNRNNLPYIPLSFRYGEIVDKNTHSILDENDEDLSAYTIVYPGVIMLNGLNLNYDFISQRVALVKKEGIITSAYLAVATDSDFIDPQYATYLLKSYDYKMVFHGIGSGIRKTLKFSDFKSISIPLPEREEQKKIVVYLDRKVEHINSLVDEAKVSIEEYKAWKASIIYEAVTKGLDTDVEMKDSGVEWIGEIPSHWRRCKIKQVANAYNGDRSSNYPSGEDIVSEGVPFITSNNLKSIALATDIKTNKYITAAKYASLRGAKLQKNDIIFCLRGSVGKCSINKQYDEGTIASSLVVFRAKGIHPDYLNYVLQNNVITEMALTTAIGIGSLNLSAENIMGFSVVVPPVEEQMAISSFLDNTCSTIERLIAEKESLITDLEAYKKSLIFEVVTGKRKVV